MCSLSKVEISFPGNQPIHRNTTISGNNCENHFSPIDWLHVKQCIENTLAAKLVSKDKVDFNINDVDANIIIIAPNKLNVWILVVEGRNFKDTSARFT